MIKVNDITYQADKNKIFVDKVTGLINMGTSIQIGKVFKNDELVDDDIENYEEILLSDFVKNNESNYINKIK